MVTSKFTNLLVTKVTIGGSDPLTDPEQVITQVWDDNEIIAEYCSCLIKGCLQHSLIIPSQTVEYIYCSFENYE